MGSHSEAASRGFRVQAPAGGRAGRPLSLVTAPEDGPPADPMLPPLPPLSPLPPPPGLNLPEPPDGPSWSPLRVSLPLFAAVWLCFAGLAGTVTAPPAADAARLGHLLAGGVAVVALVLITLSVAHAQVSGLTPRPAVVGTVALAAALGPGLWGVGAWVFALVAVAIPLAWVGGQFQSGVRRQRVERHNALVAFFTDRARRQAHETVQSIHRHDIRSMLFVVEGATRLLADANLPEDQRASFTGMLEEGLGRLAALTDVRTEEIQPFGLADVVRAVVHGERKVGRSLTPAVPDGLTAVGRAADVAAVLRTLATIAAGNATPVRLRGELQAGAVVLVVEPAGAEELPLLSGNWEQIQGESFKIPSRADEETLDLFVAARLLADQGADLWSAVGRSRFAVRLAAPSGSSPEETA
jgi:hypothetical protein